MMLTGRALPAVVARPALGSPSEARRKDRRGGVCVQAVAASENGSKRAQQRSFVWPSGARQFEDDKTALLSYIEQDNRAAILAGILSRGLVDIKRHTNYGKPLLYEAVEQGQASCVQLLLDAGLGDEKIDYYGWSSLMCAAHVGRDREIEMLISSAREHLSAGDFKAYLDRRAGARGNDGGGDTALHLASRGNFRTAVLLLLTAGANPRMPNFDGKKPLNSTTDSVVRKLIERAENGPSQS